MLLVQQSAVFNNLLTLLFTLHNHCLFRIVKYLFVLTIAFFTASCSVFTPQPRLVVLISVDQMKGSYLDSFAYEFEHGLAELVNNGIVYKNANHFHANTTTAAGHAAIATGTYPSHSSIVGNDVYNKKLNQWEYSILDTTIQFIGIENCNLAKVSAKNLLTYSFGDYQKMANPNAKTFSVALKDRAAILMGGKNADRAFWFDGTSTQMVSSNYYSSAFPLWVKNFNGKQVMADEIAEGWNISNDLELNNTTANDSFANEDGSFYPWFPHNINTFNPLVRKNNLEGSFLWSSPYGDEYVLKFSEKLIISEQLGKDKNCDVLTVGLSAAD